MKYVLPFSCLLIMLTSSCSKDLAFVEKSYEGVDKSLWPFYEEFEFQAAERGLSYDLNRMRISAEISEIHDAGVAGTCQFGSAIDNHVTIDLSFWNRASNLSKEMVVFHELGHCALLRGHDERANGAGLCLSIMRSGVEGCRDAYSEGNRTAYLDELFKDRD